MDVILGALLMLVGIIVGALIVLLVHKMYDNNQIIRDKDEGPFEVELKDPGPEEVPSERA